MIYREAFSLSCLLSKVVGRTGNYTDKDPKKDLSIVDAQLMLTKINTSRRLYTHQHFYFQPNSLLAIYTGKFYVVKKSVKTSTISFGNNYINMSTLYCLAKGDRTLMYSQPPGKAVSICYISNSLGGKSLLQQD